MAAQTLIKRSVSFSELIDPNVIASYINQVAGLTVDSLVYWENTLQRDANFNVVNQPTLIITYATPTNDATILGIATNFLNQNPGQDINTITYTVQFGF